MNIVTESLGGVAILKPDGRIDQNSAQQFQDALLAAISSPQGGSVAIDMTRVDFLSSVGLRALMVGHKQCQTTGGKLALFGFTAVVREVFSITRFDAVLSCFESRELALASFKQ